MRNFTNRQRRSLLKRADWKCQKCGVSLDSSFHADHIVPYSKGGRTDVTNGQALCRTCNLKKGNKMANIELRTWQQEALRKVIETYNNKNTFLTQATPGGGKTIHGLSVFNELRNKGLVRKLIVVVPSRELVSSWSKDAAKVYNIQLANKTFFRDKDEYKEFDGMIFTYSGMSHAQHDLRQILFHDNFMMIADEMHHVSDQATWGEAFLNSFEFSKYNLLLTGTPWTSSGKAMPLVDYKDDGYCKTDFQYSKSQAIEDGVCRAVQFRQHKVKEIKYWDKVEQELLEYDDMEHAVRDGKDRAYGDAVREVSSLVALFTEADEELSAIREVTMNKAGGLIVCADIKTAWKFQARIYNMTGVEYPVVTSEDGDSVKTINDFRNSNTKWLISVKQVSEGVDIKRIQSIIFLARAKTELFIRQVVGRAERVIHKNSDVDRVAHFHSLSHPWIDEVLRRMEKENEAGVKLLEEKEESDILEREPFGGSNDDKLLLQSLEHEVGILISRGLEYSDEELIRAIEIKKSSRRFAVMPLSVLCTIAQGEMDGDIKISTNTKEIEEEFAGTLQDEKKRIRTSINKIMKRKIARELGTKNIGGFIKNATFNLNKKIGIFSIEDATKPQLEDRLDIVERTEAASWI